jgi:hypothetical protein
MSLSALKKTVAKLIENPKVQYDKNKRPIVSLANLSFLLATHHEWFFSTTEIISKRRHIIAYDVLKDSVVTLAPAPWPLERARHARPAHLV